MQKTQNNNNGLGFDRTLPWDELPGDRPRKNAILLLLLLISLVAIYLVETTQVPEKKEDKEEVPERLARFIEERQQQEPPEPEEPEEEEQEEEEKEEEPEEEETQEEEEPETQEEKVEQARETAKKELEVFDEQLAGLRDEPAEQPDAGSMRRGGSESAEVERDLLTSRAGKGSGGIETGSVSSGGGGGGELEASKTQEVESDVAKKGQTAKETRQTESGKSQRTREQIRRVFDRYGGRMQSAYVRARRKNPALQGTVVLDLKIAPSGKVTDVSVKSSELNAPDLEQKLLIIVQTMDFGKMDVEPWDGDWTLNFFPG